MHRIMIVLVGIMVGAAAPARAWCEASCLAPQHDSPAHCPSHDSTSDTAISASITDECPALDSARPAAPARLDANAVVVTVDLPAVKTSAIHSPTVVGPQSATSVFERCTPLRI